MNRGDESMFYLWSKGRDFSPSLLGITTDLKKRLYRAFKAVEKCRKVGNFGVVRTRGPDGKIRTAGACAISESDCLLYTSPSPRDA